QFLRFQAQRGGGPGVEPGNADRIAGFLAIAIGAVIDALERRVDLGNQLALPVPRTQFQGAVAFRTGAVGHVRMVLALFLQIFESDAAFAQNFVLPARKLVPEVSPVPRVHERRVVAGPIVRNVNRSHEQTQLQYPSAAYIGGSKAPGKHASYDSLTSESSRKTPIAAR